MPDFVLVRGNGVPLYPFVNPVDDALMGITDVLRGEDLLPSTPRQLALYGALTDIGVAAGTPRFGHLPFVTGEGNKKLSKRDPQSNLDTYRERGFLPEGLVNYLALLGWSIAEDRDIFSVAELVEAFDVTRVSSNPARFDLKKAEAINATHLRELPVEEFVARVVPYLAAAGLVADPPSAEDERVLRAIAPLAQERMIVCPRPSVCSGSSSSRRSRSIPPPRPSSSPDRRRRGARRGGRCPARPGRLVDPGDRDGAQGRTGRGPRPQAPPGVRTGAGGDQRPHRLAAAVRVDRAARQGSDARPPRGRPARSPSGRPPDDRAGAAGRGALHRPAADAPSGAVAAGTPLCRPGRSSPARAAPGAAAARSRPAARRCAGRHRRARRRTTSLAPSCSPCGRGTGRWWRPLLGLLLLGVVYTVAATVVVLLTL